MPRREAVFEPDPITGMVADALADLPAGGRWLVLGCDPAILGEIDPAQPAHIRWVATDVTGRDAARDMAQSADAGTIQVWGEPVDPLADAEPFDAVAIAAPPEHDLARRWLVTARQALCPGGVVLLAGANDAGIRTITRDAAALFRSPAWEDYRKKRRIALFTSTSDVNELPAWAHEPGVAPGSWQSFTVPARDVDLSLQTVPGVFAANRLDDGTALLLAHLEVPAGVRVLDIGCGTGVIGIVAAKLGAGAVDLADANLLAVAAAHRNLAVNGVARGRAIASDVYAALSEERYDLVVSNPPFHRGKSVDYDVAGRIIDEAPAHLHPGGRLVLVANAFLAYEHRLSRSFARVETLAATPRYHVLAATS